MGAPARIQVPRPPRHPLVLQVQAQDLLAPESFWTENISANGLFIRTREPFAVGDAVHAVLSFPALLDPIHVEGVVIWVRPLSANQAAGIGVRVENEPARRKLAELSLAAGDSSLQNPAEPYRVVIAEDNPLAAQSYARVLRKVEEILSDGVVVTVAQNGHEALASIRAAPAHLIITDVYMPVMDGVRLIEAIRADPSISHVAILVISAGQEAERTACLSAGADAFLEKPIQFGQVLDTIACLRRLGDLRRRLRA